MPPKAGRPGIKGCAVIGVHASARQKAQQSLRLPGVLGQFRCPALEVSFAQPREGSQSSYILQDSTYLSKPC